MAPSLTHLLNNDWKLARNAVDLAAHLNFSLVGTGKPMENVGQRNNFGNLTQAASWWVAEGGV